MKIKSLQVSYYRSFGNEAWFSFESNIMALIGRNGVGKTNALEALSRIRFFTDDVVSTIPPNAVNQNLAHTPEIAIHGVLDDEDMLELGDLVVGQYGDSEKIDRGVGCCFRYDSKRKRTRMDYCGCFFNIMHYHPQFLEINKDCEALADYLEKSNLLQNHQEYHETIEALRDYDNFFVPHLKEIVLWCKNTLIHHVDEDHRKTMPELLDKLLDRASRCYAAFAKVSPTICLFNDAAEFPNAYSLDEIKQWDQNNRLSSQSRQALDRFARAVGSSRQELIRAFEESDERERTRIQSKIANAARKLSKQFNSSYRHGDAEVELDVRFDGNMLRFSVGNADIPGNLVWSDASAGIRWYVSVFLEIQQALKHRSVLLLVDEPAIHLHVLAQKEALRLLQKVASGTKYIVYTTHSPYMMDIERLGDVRAIVREDGASVIRALPAIKTAECRHEVLTPVCHALGYSMSVGIVPNANRLNLLVEGITDSIYLQAMMRVLKVEEDEKPYIIPCQGASSLPYVVPLLVGWGLPFKVLLDNDEAGHKAGKRIIDTYGKETDVRYVGRSESSRQIENLISEHDYKITCGEEYDAADFDKSKMAKARRFAALVDSGKLIPDEETRKNFTLLLEQFDMGIETFEQIVARCTDGGTPEKTKG